LQGKPLFLFPKTTQTKFVEVLGIKKAERLGVFFFIYHEGSLGLSKSGLRGKIKRKNAKAFSFSFTRRVG